MQSSGESSAKVHTLLPFAEPNSRFGFHVLVSAGSLLHATAHARYSSPRELDPLHLLSSHFHLTMPQHAHLEVVSALITDICLGKIYNSHLHYLEN
jgi:hypothetical protein